MHNFVRINSLGRIRSYSNSLFKFSGKDIADAFKRSNNCLSEVTWTEDKGVIVIYATISLPGNFNYLKI